MPILFSYLLKLSCSLAVVYLFYQLALRRLTFYNAARWYLLGYSLLCFFMPFININSLIEKQQWNQSEVVQAIPAIETYTGISTEVVQHTQGSSFTVWNAALLLFAFGALLLLARLVIQYISLHQLSKRAQLLAGDGIKMYQVNKDIIPFSFGNAIYINQHLHSEAELKEIIRHEFVHVKQRHTIDILWTEMLCILNWYNPAAWAIRHVVRQNLEFIADNKVLQSGFDKRDYQYLLLKVMGLPQFRIATPFNFSSLKKRIVMMNKMKSAKAHLVKFLFMLPLLTILLVAFRNGTGKLKTGTKKETLFTISGLVIDAATQAPLAHVALTETHSQATATTDRRGYFSIAVPVASYPLQTEVLFHKTGFQPASSISFITAKNMEPIGTIEIIGMTSNAKNNHSFVRSYALSSDNASFSAAPTYDEVLKKFKQNDKELYIQVQQTDTVPPPPPPPPTVGIALPDTALLPDDYKDFLAQHPDVRAVQWTDRHMIIELKSGKRELYLRNDAKNMSEAEKKWGTLPVAPPPPPPPPMVTPPKGEGPVSVKNKTSKKQEALVQMQAQQAQLNKIAQQQVVQEKIQIEKIIQDEQNIQLKKELALQVQEKQENAAAVKEQKQAIEEQQLLLLKLKEKQAALEVYQKAMQEQKQQEMLKKKPHASEN